MQYAVDVVHSGCRTIVVYSGGDIVFDRKRSKQRTQWMQYAVDAVDIFFDAKNVKPVDLVDAVTQWTQYTVNTVDAVCSGSSMQWMQ